MSAPLTSSEVAQLLRYEPETGRLFWHHRPRDRFSDERSFRTWNARYAGREAFTSVTKNGYRCGRIFDKTYFAHRVCWVLAAGEWPADDIDHINGDRADNRLENLRSTTRTHNNRNRRRSSNNTSGVTGVSWHAASRSWHAVIVIAGKQISLGYFKTLAPAEAARRAANAKHGFAGRHGYSEKGGH